MPRGRKAGEIDVQVAEIGAELRIFRLPAGSTVRDALEKAGLGGTEGDIRVDARPVGLESKLTNNQVITVVPKVHGGA